jgi:hypothetical protein
VDCELSANACRRSHISTRLESVEEDGGDYEARCPVCGRGGFRISQARSNRLRNVWTCAGRKCPAGAVRGALLRLGISAACLGIYDGANVKEIPPDVARAMDRTVSDILATPGLKLQDVRLLLAEAQGRKFPNDYKEFVKFAKGIGLAHQQAYEAARREFSRPSDCPPSNRGEVVDTSRNTEPGSNVKPCRSQPRRLT